MQNSKQSAQDNTINKSELMAQLASECDGIEETVVNDAVRELIDLMVETLAADGRVEIRGFGSFCLHHREARKARNPRTGESVEIGAKAVPHFKPGKALKEAVDYD